VSCSTTKIRSKDKRVAICIDVGNTSVKVDLAGQGGIEMLAVEPTRLPGTASRIERTLRKTRRALLDDIDVILCTVVPDVGCVLVKVVINTLRVIPFEIRHTRRLPFKLAVDRPAKVGSDRLCAAAGVFAGGAGKRTQHAIIVDIGSAVTVDLVHQRRFCGGLIFAGPVLGLRALGEYARRLPQLDPLLMATVSPKKFSDTVPSMALGARVSTVGAIKEGVEVLQKSAGCRPRIYVTGGWASVMTPHLPESWLYDPHLVTKGMMTIRGLNR
jgi:type III pantothenate kinase